MKFVSGKPAAVAGKTLLVADLHLGIEFELRRKGVRMPLQWKATAEEISALMTTTRSSELLVLGDAKHDIYGLELKEKQMMRSFFHEILESGCKKIVVAKGNHDGQLQELAAEGLIEMIGPQGALVSLGGKKYGLCHGHAWPAPELAKAPLLLLAHDHPLIELNDALGFRWSERAWILGKTRKCISYAASQQAIVFPAFNTLSGGLAFNARPCKELLGPLFENECFDLENAEARLLSGMPLGKIRALRKHAAL
ncbi:MAG: hypothetical protein AB1626_03945 [Candidatus Micrarchaeota archaeon]